MAELILTTEQLCALGRIAAESARTEVVIDNCIRVLTMLKPAQYEALNGGSMMIGRKIEILRILGPQKLRSAKKKAHLKLILDELASLNSDRSAYVHGEWRSDSPQGLILKAMLPAGDVAGSGFVLARKKGKERKLTAEKLGITADKIEKGHEALFGFYWDNWLKPRWNQYKRRLAKKG